MKVTLGLAQIRRPKDKNVLAQVECYCRQAKEADVDVLVFPEMLMTPFGLPAEDFAAAAQPVDGKFGSAVNALAAEYGLWIIYTMNEAAEEALQNDLAHAAPQPSDDCERDESECCIREDCDDSEKSKQGNACASACPRPFNTAIVVGPDGIRRTRYRKVHLFDADFSKESEKMQAGSSFTAPVDTPFGKIACAICYDLRYPEIARAAALEGADFMLYPAAWYKAPTKLEQWRAMLISRAVENEMFVAGACRADDSCIGHSLVASPDGRVLAEADDSEQLLVCQVETDLLSRLRHSIPILQGRRPECYGRLTEE